MTSPANELWRIISEKNIFQKKFLTAVLKDFDDERQQEAESYIDFSLYSGATLEYLAEAYLYFVDMTQEEQLFFARTGHYRYSKACEVEKLVYNNPEIMKKYMDGLALSVFLWPQHNTVHSLFKQLLPRTIKFKTYLEIGHGHGLLFVYALKNRGYGEYVGIDISRTSLDKTQALMDFNFTAALPADKVKLINSDFLAADFDGRFDTVVMGETIEHVERPDLFLKKASEAVAPEGLIFISTCFNAPELDHIYNFYNFEELENMFAAVSLDVVQKHPIPYPGKTVEQCLKKRLPVNVAYVLAPKS